MKLEISPERIKFHHDDPHHGCHHHHDHHFSSIKMSEYNAQTCHANSSCADTQTFSATAGTDTATCIGDDDVYVESLDWSFSRCGSLALMRVSSSSRK